MTVRIDPNNLNKRAGRFRRDILPEALERRDLWIRCVRGEMSYADLQEQIRHLYELHGEKIYNREEPLL